MKVEQITDSVINNSLSVNDNKSEGVTNRGIVRNDNGQHHRTKKQNERDDYNQEKTGSGVYAEEIIADFDNGQIQDRNNASSPLEDENDKTVSRLLMLYLKTLKGHLSTKKFLEEANPQRPYSSVQDMIKHLKEKNFPSDFLQELKELDSETNDKEINEDLNEGKEFTHHSSDLDYDRDYMDYPAHDTK